MPITKLVGSALAGFIIALSGVLGCFMINAISYLLVIISLILMKIQYVPDKKDKQHPFLELRDGLDYISNGLEKALPYFNLLFGLGLLVFSFSTSFVISFVILIFVGLGLMLQLASSNTLVQQMVDNSKRGRLMGFYTFYFSIDIQLAELLQPMNRHNW